MKWFILRYSSFAPRSCISVAGQAVLAAGAGSFHVHRAAELLHVRVFSVPNQPYLDRRFPELKVLLDRCDRSAKGGLAPVRRRAIGIRGVQRRRLLVLQERLEALPEVVPRPARCARSRRNCSGHPEHQGRHVRLAAPGSRLPRRRDPYAGSLRFHMGLITLRLLHQCRQRDLLLARRRAVVFDETFIHYAENKTDQNRIILFADVGVR